METVLAIEDSQVSRALLEEILGVDFRVAFACDGEEGLAAVRDLVPDVILLDIHLPGIDGFEVCRRIKAAEATRDIPVIIITSLSREEERVMGFQAGADDYVVKPFYPGELIARVKAHLATKKAQEQAIELERLNLFKELAVAVNHEVNNPLTSALAYLYVIEREVKDPSPMVRESLAEIHKELLRIWELTSKMAKASKVKRTSYIRDTMMIDLLGMNGEDR